MAQQKDFAEAVEAYTEKAAMYHMEGTQGVRNLRQIVSVLGYSDLEDFLVDNSFAQQALLEALMNLDNPPAEWTEAINEQLEMHRDPLSPEDYNALEEEPFEEDPEGDGTLPSALPRMEYYSEE